MIRQVSHYGGGTADEASPQARAALAAELRGKTGYQAAIRRDVDEQIGHLLGALDESGIADSTYVVVTFDHCASVRNANAPLAGRKGRVFEGGIRVPFFVRGPGITPGSCAPVRASTADLLPTLAEFAGVRSLPAGIEGSSLAEALTRGGPVTRSSQDLVVQFPHYDLQNGGPASAILVGDHELVRRYEDGARLLFDLRNDPGERHDLAAEDPARVQDLERRLDAYLQSIQAGMPTPNSAYRK